MNAMPEFKSLIQEIDYGTPASQSEKTVTLNIDGRDVTVPEGTSIMRAGMELGVEIPKLCATDMLDSFGSCRVCLVEIEGRGGTPASCTTPVAEGMVVKTQTERLNNIRRGVMELYVSDHPMGWDADAGIGGSEFDKVVASVGSDREPLWRRRPEPCGARQRIAEYRLHRQGRIQSLFHLRRLAMHRLLALRARLRGGAGHLCADHHRQRLRVPRRSRHVGELHRIRNACPAAPACRPARPTRCAKNPCSQMGRPEHSVVTTCAYCGVGCSFKAEMKGEELVRMVPYKDGKANRGHSCVKGRFAYGYSTHKDRILNPMIREKITDPWREVSWEEALAHTANEFRRIQYQYGRGAVGGITSSRCTNEETYLVQKLVRQGFLNNNVDTCARVCHSPTGYGLGQTYGTSAGTQDFDSVDDADVVMIIGANPTDGHPVFASRLKKRLRKGAKLIVLDPRRTDIVRSAHVEAQYHLPLKPGTNVAVITALAHVIVTEGLFDEKFIRERCDWDEFQDWASFVAEPENSPEVVEQLSGVDPADSSAAQHGSTPRAATARSITASASPSTARARPPSWPSPTSPWRPAISAAGASA